MGQLDKGPCLSRCQFDGHHPLFFLTMSSCKTNRKNNCRHGMFEVFPSQFRLGHLPPGVSEQVFDRETSDIAQLKGLQTISVGICTADKLASLGGHLLSQPLPATHLLLCNNLLTSSSLASCPSFTHLGSRHPTRATSPSVIYRLHPSRRQARQKM